MEFEINEDKEKVDSNIKLLFKTKPDKFAKTVENLAEELKAVAYSYKGYMSVAEVIGTLHVVTYEILKDQK